jgi:hypothetical protein
LGHPTVRGYRQDLLECSHGAGRIPALRRILHIACCKSPLGTTREQLDVLPSNARTGLGTAQVLQGLLMSTTGQGCFGKLDDIDIATHHPHTQHHASDQCAQQRRHEQQLAAP